MAAPNRQTGISYFSDNNTNSSSSSSFKYPDNPLKNPDAGAKDPGVQGWAQIGLGGAGLISNIITSAQQYNLAKQQIAEEKKQRELENKRYNQQMQRNIQATNDAAGTSTGLQSAQSNFQASDSNAQSNAQSNQGAPASQAPEPRMAQH